MWLFLNQLILPPVHYLMVEGAHVGTEFQAPSWLQGNLLWIKTITKLVSKRDAVENAHQHRFTR